MTGALDTVNLKTGYYTFDQMEIHSTAIQIHRYMYMYVVHRDTFSYS